jgi:hypothetical protein
VLAEVKALAGKTKAEMMLKQLLESKQQHCNAWELCYANQKMQTSSVSYVVAPNGQGEWVEVNHPQASMEQALMAKNHH